MIRVQYVKFGVVAGSLSVLISSLLVSPQAHAVRPLVQTSVAIKNLRMSLPIAFDAVSDKDFSGLDKENEKTRALVLRQANEYSDLRSGRRNHAAFQHWVENCDPNVGTSTENPFCRFEQERKRLTATARASKGSFDERQALINSLKQGQYEKFTGVPYGMISTAIHALDSSGDLNKAAGQYADSKTCQAPLLSYLLGYKIEEQFPSEEAVALTTRLYRKGSECGKDLYSAQSSFRLGLLLIWKKQYSEIPDLMAKVETTPEASAFHARAKYWRHFVASETGNATAKQAARDALLKDNPLSFQTLAISGDDPTALAQIMRAGAQPNAAIRSVVRSEVNPLIRGTEALIQIGANNLAAELVDKNVAEFASVEPEVRLYVATLMNKIGFALPKFKILSSLFQDVPQMVTLDTMKMFFPIWYVDIVKKQERALDPLLILSLIRQESAFNKLARSGVGARGLMQVMPATARTVASVRTAKLFDPTVNIGVGTKYFSQKLHQYDGDVELTLAAYNAGFSRVDQWKKRYPTDNRMLFLDFIPFRETREYVSSILRNYYWYVRLYNEEEVKEAVAGEVPLSIQKMQAIMSANSGTAATMSRGK